MAIKEKTVLIGVNSRNRLYWMGIDNKRFQVIEEKDRSDIKIFTKIEVLVEDLPKVSHEKVTKVCDFCGTEGENKQRYSSIIKYRESGDGLDRCVKCGRLKGEQTKKYNVPFDNSVSYKAPHLIAEWHITLNELSPSECSYGSHTKFWWICPDCNSEYDMSPNDRISRNSNCPYCAGQRVNETNCLATTHPQLIKEFDIEKNHEIKINIYNIKAGTNKKIWWKCLDCNSTYDMSGNNKCQNQGCPYCKGSRVNHTNSLRTTHLNIALEWHPTKNTRLSPDNVTYGSDKVAWWLCPDCGSDYDMKISTRGVLGSNCPYCAGRRVNDTNCLASINPQLVNLWHPTLNGDITPYSVTGKNYKVVWWLGICGHKWENSIYCTTLNDGKCPYCSGDRVCDENCLISTHPNLIKEWHPSKNGNMKPNDFTYGSHKNVWWLGECGHEWEAIIKNRTSQQSGCPICNESKGEKKINNYLSINNIRFMSQYRIDACKNILPLPFDFAVFDSNKLLYLIEYDGQQHYEPNEFFGGEKAFKQTQINDKIKNTYCEQKSIDLLRIPYWEFNNIESILNTELNKYMLKKEVS